MVAFSSVQPGCTERFQQVAVHDFHELGREDGWAVVQVESGGELVVEDVEEDGGEVEVDGADGEGGGVEGGGEGGKGGDGQGGDVGGRGFEGFSEVGYSGC